MIATLIQISVMRSSDWHVDIRLLSFAREAEQIRGLLVLKTGWAGFDLDRAPQRRLYGHALWCLRIDVPLARPIPVEPQPAPPPMSEGLRTFRAAAFELGIEASGGDADLTPEMVECLVERFGSVDRARRVAREEYERSMSEQRRRLGI